MHPAQIEYGERNLTESAEDEYIENISVYGTGTPPGNKKGLPPGSTTGSMLHEILEKISFAQVDKSDSYSDMLSINSGSNKIIENKINKFLNPLDGENLNFYKDETAKLIWNTLKTPINSSGASLCHIQDRIQEMEFFFRINGPKTKIPGTEFKRGFIHGFIDLVFMHRDKFYILDWKSNTIDEGYTFDSLEKNIEEMHYDLQYNIYSIAVIKWLKQSLADYSYEKNFGGIYYIYLRGMNAEDPNKGIFFYRPKTEEEIFMPFYS